MEEQIIIRDIRRKEKFQMDDEYLSGYARLCGWQATLVYNSLCRHADKEQKCYPSIDLMAEQHKISRPTVLKGIKNLEKWGVIIVKKQKDQKTKRQRPNIYVLCDKTMWVPKPSKRGILGAESTSDSDPSKRQYKSRVNDIDCKDTHIKDTHIRSILKKTRDTLRQNGLRV